MNARSMLHDMACLLAAVACLWALQLYFRVLPTYTLAAAWAAAALLIGAGLFRASRVRRRALLAVYLAAESPWRRWLRGGPVMAARSAGIAAVLALVLVVGLARSADRRLWWALILSVPLVVLTRALVHKHLTRHVNAGYLALVSWRTAALVAGCALLALMVTLAYHQPQPDFGAVSLERAVWHLVDQEHARSGPAEVALQAAAAKDGLRLWLAQQLMPAPAASFLQLLGWLAVLATEALFVWSYLLMAYGVLVTAGAHDRGKS